MSRKISIILSDSNYLKILKLSSRVSFSDVINKTLNRYFIIREDALNEYKLKKGVYKKCGH